MVLPERYNFDTLQDLTSIGKHKSPRSASKSPLPSIPEPAALTTKKGRSITCIALALAIGSQDLVTASTPFGIPAKTQRNSLSYWLDTFGLILARVIENSGDYASG